MKLVEMFTSMFAAAKAEGIAIEDVATDATPEQAIASLTPTDPRVAELLGQVESLHAAQRAARATAFADAQIAARRAVPAERETLIALHSQAAADDAAHGGSRAASVEQAYAARPAHVLMGEQIGNAGLVALLNGAAAEDADAGKARLMKMTAVGRTALKQSR